MTPFSSDNSGLRTAEQLSALKQTRSTPLLNVSLGLGSCSIAPSFSVATIAPLPRSSTRGTRFERASFASASVPGDSINPPMKKLLRCTFRIRAVSGPRARA